MMCQNMGLEAAHAVYLFHISKSVQLFGDADRLRMRERCRSTTTHRIIGANERK